VALALKAMASPNGSRLVSQGLPQSVLNREKVTQLAERVGLSLSPCHRRVRVLEEWGGGYRAQLDPAALGLNSSAIVFATLREGDRQAVEAFEAALVQIPQVVDAQRLFGKPDYLLQVITQDLPAFQRLYDDCLSTLPNVQRLTSALVMKRVVQDRPLSL
jgi:DNA-binding Lrp family transcriptional regulator